MKAYKEVEVKLHSFLTSTTDKGKRQAWRPDRFTLRKNLGTPEQEAGWALEKVQTILRRAKSLNLAGIRALDQLTV